MAITTANKINSYYIKLLQNWKTNKKGWEFWVSAEDIKAMDKEGVKYHIYKMIKPEDKPELYYE